jgi:hypothetical protein
VDRSASHSDTCCILSVRLQLNHSVWLPGCVFACDFCLLTTDRLESGLLLGTRAGSDVDGQDVATNALYCARTVLNGTKARRSELVLGRDFSMLFEGLPLISGRCRYVACPFSNRFLPPFLATYRVLVNCLKMPRKSDCC